MNKIYKLAKNEKTGSSVVVSELAKGNKKSISGKLLTFAMGLFLVSGAMAGESITVSSGDDIVAIQYSSIYAGVWNGSPDNTKIQNKFYGNNASETGGSNNYLLLNYSDEPDTGITTGTLVFSSSFGYDSTVTSFTNNTLIVNNATLINTSVHIINNYALTKSSDIYSANNSLIYNSGTTGLGYLAGSYIYSIGGNTTANNNSVTVNGGNVGAATVVGAESASTNNSIAQSNTVTINGGEFNYKAVNVFGGTAAAVLAGTDNTTPVIPDSVSADASQNIVNINGGNFSGSTSLNISAGQLYSSSRAPVQSLSVTSNIVNINSIGETPTTVTIEGGNVNFLTYSNSYGSEYAGTVSGTANIDVSVSNNTVSINNATINSTSLKIYGGQVTLGGQTLADGGTVDVNVTDNTVNLTNNGSLSISTADLYGGYVSGTKTGATTTTIDVVSGNTLNLYANVANTVINSAQNFENYNFYAGSSIVSADVLLSSTTAISVDYLANDGTTVKDINVTLGDLSTDSTLTSGDYITLIENATNTNGSKTYVDGVGSTTQKGIGTYYETTIKLDGSNLNAYFGSGHATEQSKAFFEGKLAGLAFVNQGSDLVIDRGIKSALRASQDSVDWEAFAAMSGGKSRYETGSHANIRGVEWMTGFSKAMDQLMVGGFIEGGWGKYDSHNKFSTHSMKGDGSIDYFGAGLLANYKLDENAYLTGSLRAGRVKTDFKSNQFLSGAGERLSGKYDTKSSYLSAQIGAGYIIPLEDKQFIDLNTNYIWTHQGSDSVKVNSGDKLKFDSLNSHRLRAEGRYIYKLNNVVQPYASLAYEYEFDGKAKGSVNGYNLSKYPDLKGGTGILEIGTRSESIAEGFSFDISVKGYTGVRQGVSGQLAISYGF